LSYEELLNRVKELEDLLGCREIMNALSFTSLHYTSNNRPEDAERTKSILNKIIDTLREK